MKKCRHCMEDINKKAKRCPNCGGKQGLPFLKPIIIIVVIIGIIILLIQSCAKAINDAVDETFNNSDSLVLEEGHSGSLDEYGFSYYISGYVKNTGDKKYSYVQITFTTYDAEGNTLGTCLDNNSGLEANGRWKVNAICLSSTNEIASYKMTEITGW